MLSIAIAVGTVAVTVSFIGVATTFCVIVYMRRKATRTVGNHNINCGHNTSSSQHSDEGLRDNEIYSYPLQPLNMPRYQAPTTAIAEETGSAANSNEENASLPVVTNNVAHSAFAIGENELTHNDMHLRGNIAYNAYNTSRGI